MPDVPRDLAAAARIHAARERVVDALGVLAASPLDTAAAARMRAALDEAGSAEVRSAIRRIVTPSQRERRGLRVVQDRSGGGGTPGPPEGRRRTRFAALALVGGAA